MAPQFDRALRERLRAAGCVLVRQGKGSHEIWMHPQTRIRVTIPNHPGDMPEGTLRAIIRMAGFTPQEFLDL